MLQPRHTSYPALEAAPVQVDYRLGRQAHSLLVDHSRAAVADPETIPSPHGPLRAVRLEQPANPHGLRASVTFAMPADQPFFLWKLELHNTGPAPVFIDRLALLSGNLKSKISHPKFFSNGWGSWNYTGAYGPDDRTRRTRLGPLSLPLHANPGTPQHRAAGRFGSDMFGVLGDTQRRTALLAGFLSQLEHFGTVETDLRQPEIPLRLWANGDGARLDPGAATHTDWACIFLVEVDNPEPLDGYLQAVFKQSAFSDQLSADSDQLKSKISNLNSKIPNGWCSWYQYFQKVTVEDIRRNLEFAAANRAGLPLDLIQIDDGFETLVGDWYSFRPGFADGPAPLAREIRAAGFTPGLWLAPFIVDPRSRLAKEHPDWLLRGRFNRPVNAGFIWNTFTTALDLTHPPALEYACQVIATAAHQWEFPYLKLDFLYAAALPGRYRDPTRTRAQVLRAGLQALRQAAGPETFLLGCGCPLGSAVGLVEAMRIGADVAPNWHPQYFGTEFFFRPEPDMPSARNAIQNSLARTALHRRWWLNDPDCLLARQTELSLAEVQALATVIALSGGLLLLSDDLPALPPERLRLIQQLFPPVGDAPQALDWLDSSTPARLRLDLDGPAGPWHLLGLFNWQDAPQTLPVRPADFRLDPGQAYLAREFWSGALLRPGRFSPAAGQAGPPGTPVNSSGQGAAETCQVWLAPHGTALLAVRRFDPAVPAYLGGDLHFSQGVEVSEWQPGADGLRLRLERPGKAQGNIDLYLPGRPQAAQLNGQPCAWQENGPNIYRVEVDFEREGEMEIAY